MLRLSLIGIFTVLAGLCAAFGAASQADAAFIKYQDPCTDPEVEADPKVKGALPWALRCAVKVLKHSALKTVRQSTLIALRDREAGGMALRLFAATLTLVIVVLTAVLR